MRSSLLATAALLLAYNVPAAAQSSAGGANVENRVGKLEGEMRAVQRKVFPGGAGRYLQPDVEAAPVPEVMIGAPATSAVGDLTARVASLEGQMTSLTGQVEEAGHRAREVQEQFDAYRRATDARLKALEAGPAARAAAGPSAGSASTAVDDETPVATPRPRPSPASSKLPTTAPKATDMGREAKLTAITKPDTGDAAEDAYLYGYRLWQAKQYPEAQAALKKAATDYPKSRRYSYSQNLLGRAYLDDGKPSLASMAFYDNYKKMPDGERAPESLFYLASALQTLKKPADACKVYDELTDVYGAKIGAKMKADVAAGRVAARCK